MKAQQLLIVVEIVDIELTSVADTTEVYVEVRWATSSVKTNVHKPLKGVVTMCERVGVAVPTISQRRLPMEIFLFCADTKKPLASVMIQASDILQGRRVRANFPMKAIGNSEAHTAYVLGAAIFLDDLVSSNRPGDIALCAPGELTLQIDPNSPGGQQGANTSSSGSSPPSNKSFAAGGGGRSFAGGVSFAGDAGSFSNANNMSVTNASMKLDASAGRVRAMSMSSRVNVEVQTDISGPVIPVSSSAAALLVKKREQERENAKNSINNNINDGDDLTANWGKKASTLDSSSAAHASSSSSTTNSDHQQHRSSSSFAPIMKDEEALSEIRKGFNFPVSNPKAESAAEKANTVVGSCSLKAPVDLLTMKRTVAAWPRDEVEGLIVYGQQMKRYAEELERQNARLVLAAMKHSAAELRDMPRSEHEASMRRSASRSMSQATIFNNNNMNSRAQSPSASVTTSFLDPHRSVSFAQPQQSQLQQQPSTPRGFSSSVPTNANATLSNSNYQSRSGSEFGGGGGGGESRILPSFIPVGTSGGGGDDNVGDNTNFLNVNTFENSRPEFLMQIENQRGRILDDREKKHILDNFSEL